MNAYFKVIISSLEIFIKLMFKFISKVLIMIGSNEIFFNSGIFYLLNQDLSLLCLYHDNYLVF